MKGVGRRWGIRRSEVREFGGRRWMLEEVGHLMLGGLILFHSNEILQRTGLPH